MKFYFHIPLVVFLLARAGTAVAQFQGLPHQMYWKKWRQSQARLDGLRGPVRKILEHEAGYLKRDNRSYEDLKLPQKELHFGRQGNLLLHKQFRSGGLFWWQKKYVYNSRGRLSSVLRRHIFPRFHWNLHISYDAKGNIREAHYLKPGGQFYRKAVYICYTNDNRVVRLLYVRGKQLSEKAIHRFDTRGRISVIETFDGTGRERTKTEFQYGKKSGRLLERRVFFRGGPLVNRYRYRYNKRGYVSRRVTYNAEGVVSSRVAFSYQYDSYGNWIRKKESNLTLEASGKGKKRKVRRRYEPLRALYRKITYYKK